MKKYLAEQDIEEAAIDWLLEQPLYQYQHGSELKRPFSKAILEDRFEAYLGRRYPHVPEKIRAEVMQEFLFNRGADLHHRNLDFHLKLSKGLSKTWKDAAGKDHFEHFYALNFEAPAQNEFLVVNQFSIHGKSNRRPDLLIFVNGLPLVLFEFKNLFDTEATVDAAYNQVQHYLQDIPQVFETNALTIISDGLTTLHGMFSSPREWFAAWKSTDGHTVTDGFALETLIKGLLVPERLLFYIRHFIFHELDNGQLLKKGAKYHQFFGVQHALAQTLKSVRPFGDGRIGVIWHTTRSGKSITMAIYAGILRQLPALKNPTIVVQVDRFDLNRQLFEDFVAAKDLVGDVAIANTTDELRQLLSGEGGGVVFSTVQKFNLKETAAGKEAAHPILSTRENVIVIADECHRTQYGLVQGFASNLRTALPNASLIGFTGTPVDTKDADTIAVFGDIIHTYDIRQATADHAVVPIYYEPRLAKLHLANEQLEEQAEEITEGLEESDKNKIMWAAIEDAAGSKERVAAIARDILKHYQNRNASLEGKAMIVCMSRRNCVKLYNAITALEGCPEVSVIMTGNIAKDPVAWNPHIRTKEAMEAVKTRFKNPTDDLKIVIVRDMWLTGFDNPSLHTLYVDKVMSGHNLIQAVNRVATVFKDKPSGLIVDYIGIGDKLRDATKKYTSSGGEGKVAFDVEEAFDLTLEVISDLQQQLPASFYAEKGSVSGPANTHIEDSPLEGSRRGVDASTIKQPAENRNNVQTPLSATRASSNSRLACPQGDSLDNSEKQEVGIEAKSPFGGGRGRTSRIPENPDNVKILPPTLPKQDRDRLSEGGQTEQPSEGKVGSTFSGQNPTVFKYQHWPYLSKGDQLKLVAEAANFFVADDTICKTFMLNEKKLSSLVPVIKNHERVKEIALEIIFFQHVGAAVRKVKFPTTNIRKKEGQIKELIHRSIDSEEVVDVFEMAGIERFDISIINDDFLATAKVKKSGNELKLELIRQILNDEIKVRVSRNLVKYRKLKEEVEKIIQDYHNHFFDSLIAMEKYREIARAMQEEDKRRLELGLTEDEEAFYEIIASHKTALQDFTLIKELVQEITATLQKNTHQPDWYKKPDVKAHIMISVKRILSRKGVGAELQVILNEIMEQAEERYREMVA